MRVLVVTGDQPGWLNNSFEVSPVKAAVVSADGVGQGDGAAGRDGGSAHRTPVQQVCGNLHHAIAAGGTGKHKREIGLASGYS